LAAPCSGRRLAAWQETDAAINALLTTEGDILRRRCRALVRKNHWARRAQDSYVANAIGTGINPESLHPNQATREQIRKLWERSQYELDADDRTDWGGLQAIALRESSNEGPAPNQPFAIVGAFEYLVDQEEHR